MEDQQFKRHIAFKYRIGDLLVGKPVMEAERFKHLEIGSKNVVRVNILGNIVDKYDNDGEKQYSFFTLDDGSGQLKLKCFGDDSFKFKHVNQGQTVLVIGVLRYWNNETYLTPEIIKEQDSKYLLIRKLELEKKRNKNVDPLGKSEIVAVKDKILGAIKNAEEDGGIEIEQIKNNLTDISTQIIDQEIEKFISEGIVFEPRPGKVRYLGSN